MHYNDSIHQAMKPVLEVHDLTVSYKKPVLWDVDLSLPSNKVIGVIGPNGPGKSTLLKTIMGLATPDSGYVRLFGEDLSQVSYVPQTEPVDWNFPASVLEVVIMGRYARPIDAVVQRLIDAYAVVQRFFCYL